MNNELAAAKLWSSIDKSSSQLLYNKFSKCYNMNANKINAQDK